MQDEFVPIMDATELNGILSMLGWPLEHFAHVTKRDYSRIRKMASGRSPIDPAMARWLRQMLVVHEDKDQRRALLDRPPRIVARQPVAA